MKSAKVDHLALEVPEPEEVLRVRIDRLVSQLDAFEKPLVAKALMAKSLDVSLQTMGALATISMVHRAADLLGGRWSEESRKVFIETDNY